ncbi:lipid A-modifier LpxR family protein [Paragemmobacter ruber]|uniref:DUF2219 family protein n=1 Tax=Paragemmobacter ruber TaxID=1985673 RepID=A0ABW9Y3R6_9RHOB|nr:lipid A-modifier LpxR family protein [Rhodobacter ruber]NBE06776.1 DUF2219 family protein [Rhodobacter ruber]
MHLPPLASSVFVVALGALSALPLGGAAAAQERGVLGWGRLLTNDAIGDGKDRWRTGSYVLSYLRGPDWNGSLPATPGQILEFRFRLETIAPADLVTPNPLDRRYVGALSLGLHTHFEAAGLEASVGADAVIVGPQTGISSLHGDLHDLLGLPTPNVFGGQIGDEVFLTVTAEVGRTLTLGPNSTFRPFLEAQAGAETLVRVGGDFTFGQFTTGALMLRDTSTGQRYRGVAGSGSEGLSLIMGGDIAEVYDSEYFLAGDAITPSDTRKRLRAGLHWQGAQSEVFYGLTWLSEEFDQQPDDQIVGSINLRLQF